VTTTRTITDEMWLGDLAMPKPGETERFRRDCRIMGVAVGQAVGDALGSPYEFRHPPAYGTARFGRGTFGHGVAQWTDDSEQMALVLRARSDPRKIAEGLLEWRTIAKDVGNQTRAILLRASTPAGMVAASRAYAKRQEATPRPEGWHPGSGNGGIMRTSVVGLPFLGDRPKIAEAARKISALTHASEWDQDAAMVWSLLVEAAVMRGGEEFDLPAAVADALEFVTVPVRRDAWAALADVALRANTLGSAYRINGSAFGAFAAALWSVSHSGSYEETVQRACSIGTDTDTVAAIAGGLAGAIYNVLDIPSSLARRVWGWPGMDAHGLATLALEAARRSC